MNFATGRATVEYDPKQTGARALVGVVRDVGYDTPTASRAELELGGAPVSGAEAAVLEERIAALKGVLHGELDPERRIVRVEYIQGATDPVTLRDALADLGHEATVVSPSADAGSPTEDAEGAARSEEYRDLRRRFWVAALLSLPVLVMAMSHGRIAWLDFPGGNWVQLVLTTPVVFYSGAQSTGAHGPRSGTGPPT